MKILERHLQIKHAESKQNSIPFESWLLRQYRAIMQSEDGGQQIPHSMETMVLMNYRAGLYGEDIPDTPQLIKLNWIQLREEGKIQSGDKCDLPGFGEAIVTRIVGPHAMEFLMVGMDPSDPQALKSSQVIDPEGRSVIITKTPAQQNHQTITDAVAKLPPLAEKVTPLGRPPAKKVVGKKSTSK